jgi:hypothetical protein
MLDVEKPTEYSTIFTSEKKDSDLFAGVEEVKAEDPNHKEEGFPEDFESQIVIEKDSEVALSYNGFLERLRRPGSRDLVDCIRRFINSVLGPRYICITTVRMYSMPSTLMHHVSHHHISPHFYSHDICPSHDLQFSHDLLFTPSQQGRRGSSRGRRHGGLRPTFQRGEPPAELYKGLPVADGAADGDACSVEVRNSRAIAGLV